MRFCTFARDGENRFGFELQPGMIVDLIGVGEALLGSGQIADLGNLLESKDLKAWLTNGREAIQTAERIRDLMKKNGEATKLAIHSQEDVRLLAPILNPGKIMAIGLNYHDHAQEQKTTVPENPLIFCKFSTSLIGPEDEIRLPAISQKVDPEAELCVVMLKTGRNFSYEEARDAIAGYTIGNDVSARDLQFSDKQWVRGKSCDTFAPCGPFLVTGDELDDPHQLDISLRVNERVQQSDNTRNLMFDCYSLVSYISQAITLQTGDLIFTGTPSGVGVYRDPPVFLKAGDVVEITVEKIGTLRNPVRDE